MNFNNNNKMNYSTFLHIAPDYNAPPGITHPLFKENYAWVDQELEKRSMIFPYKHLIPVPINWLFHYSKKMPVYQELEDSLITSYNYEDINSDQFTFTSDDVSVAGTEYAFTSGPGSVFTPGSVFSPRSVFSMSPISLDFCSSATSPTMPSLIEIDDESSLQKTWIKYVEEVLMDE